MNKPIITNAKNSMYLHMGVHVFSFLFKGSDTAGKFSMMHIQIRKGFESPPHTHTRENESFYILEGCMRFSVGDDVFEANQGDFVYLPKNIMHRWESLTEIS
jgi:quercetin dioxygenase-like cupin family protein